MQAYYNIDQLKLELSTQYQPKANHIVWTIHQFVEDLELHHPYIFGRPREYSFSMLLKLLLYAYSRGIFTSRPIERLAEENLPARWLTQERTPCYRTICRFRRSPDLAAILSKSFEQFVAQLKVQGLLGETVFIDGTKLLADANKYSFVWKKNTLRFKEMNRQQIIRLINEMREYHQLATIPEETPMSLEELEELIVQLEVHLEDLDQAIEAEPKRSPLPNQRERRFFLSKHRQLQERKIKLQTYQHQQHVLGTRNSYSKTDPDATFMRMKEDPMKNGQLKPGYNLQVATHDQYFLAYDLYANPTDTRTLPLFFESHRALFESMKVACLDAGYGSQANYQFLEDQFPDLVAVIPFNTYLKEQSRKWQSDERKVMNWHYDEINDSYVDPQGVRFYFNAYRIQNDKYGFERRFKEYLAERYTPDLEAIPEALTPKGRVRRIRVNPELEYFKAKQRRLLSNPTYQEIYSQRKTDVEPAFGHLKACLGFTRFHLRGQEGVHTEIGIALMAANLKKLSQKLSINKETQKLFSCRIKFWVLFETFVTASY